jgi:hypothetical protein
VDGVESTVDGRFTASMTGLRDRDLVDDGVDRRGRGRERMVIGSSQPRW